MADNRSGKVNQEIRKLSHSFCCAARGFAGCVKTERNLRIHIAAAAYVSVFARMGRVDIHGCTILCLCFALVIGAELMNTAIERLCDTQAQGYNSTVREAKDIAAAAVFVCALFCVVIGAALFLSSEVLGNIAGFLYTHLWFVGCLVVSIPVAVAFVFGSFAK